MTERPVATYSIAASLREWAGKENLQERVDGIEQINPIVLGILREATG